MDFTLTPDQELIRSTARELCERELVPNARDWDEAEELPRSLVGTLADAGFLAASLPEELGGGGLDSVSYCLLCEELGRADSSVRGIVSVSNGLYGKTVAKWGSDEQRAEHLPGLASGERARLLRPDGARLRLRRGRARHAGRTCGGRLGAVRVEGLHHARVVGEHGDRVRSIGSERRAARDHRVPRPDRRGRLRRDADEGQARAPRAGHGGARRSTASACPTPRGSARRAQGFKVAMSALDNGRISLAAGCVGIAQGCLDACVAYAGERRAFGKPVAGFQLVQQLLAEMHVETEAARLLTWKAAALADAGQPYTTEAAVAKWYASEAAVRAANAAVQVLGGYGYVDEYPVAKYLRDARVTTLYEGTSQIQTLIVGRALTGENAFT